MYRLWIYALINEFNICSLKTSAYFPYLKANGVNSLKSFACAFRLVVLNNPTDSLLFIRSQSWQVLDPWIFIPVTSHWDNAMFFARIDPAALSAELLCHYCSVAFTHEIGKLYFWMLSNFPCSLVQNYWFFFSICTHYSTYLLVLNSVGYITGFLTSFTPFFFRQK